MSNFWSKRIYAEASTEVDGLSERGYVYLFGKKFDLGAGSTTSICMTTNTLALVFQGFSISSTSAALYAELLEDATVTKSTSAGSGYNINRNYSDAHTAIFTNVTSFTGGTVVAEELVLSSNNVAYDASSTRVHWLKTSSDYVMRFTNLGNQSTTVHFQLAWAENEPTPKGLWTT